MTKDLNKGISSITYNSLNLPQTVNISNSINTYVYSAMGTKLSVSQPNKKTDYVGNMIYENNTLKRILVDGGYYEPSTSKYYFYLTDHLGNNRVVADQTGAVAQTNHYYPFGMSFADGITTDKQPYKYNGKELDADRGLNWYDYSARQYDGIRFTTIDPLAEKRYWISPYAYCSNNPLNRIDPDGMDDYYLNEDGRMVLARRTDDKFDNLYGKDGSSIRVNDQSLLPQLKIASGNEKQVAGETFSSTDAFNVYSFVVNNSNVEWSLAGFKDEKQTSYVLNTNYEKDGVSYNKNGNNENDLLFHIHSHPGNSKESKEASGYDLYSAGIKGGNSDAEFMKNRFNSAKSANRKWPSEYPKLFFYHKNTSTLYHYNHKTDSQIVGKVATPAIMKTLINQLEMKP